MPPTIALFACLVFILILLRLDPARESEVSSALWVPTIWALIIGSRMVSLWFSFGGGGQTAEAYADGSPIDRDIFLLLIAIALLIVIKRGIGFSKIAGNNPWLCLFLIYCAVSIAWSDFPLVSFKRYIKEIGNLLMVLIVLTEKAPIEAMRTVLKRCAYILVPLSIVLFKYYADLGRSYDRWEGSLSVTGVTNNKNSLGLLCAVCGVGLLSGLLSIWRTRKRSANKKVFWIHVSMLAMTLWVLTMAKSATSIGCFVAAAAIIIFTGLKTVRKNMTAYILISLLIVSIFLMAGSLVSFTAGALGRDETLTGRTDVWKSALAMGTNPLIGDGYSSFWLGNRMEKIWQDYAWHPTEAHDGYLEIYLDLGIVGLTLLAGVIISSFRSALKLVRANYEHGSLLLAILVMGLLYNITESAFRPGLLMYFIFMFAVARMPRRARASTQQGRPLRESTLVTRNEGLPQVLTAAKFGLSRGTSDRNA